jgi:pimeloyl-ACP methyl ester carboxylesterase
MSASTTGVPREPRGQALRYWLAERKLQVFAWTLIAVLVVGGLGLWKAGAVDPTGVSKPGTSFGTAGANIVETGNLGPDVEVGAVGDGLTRTYIIRGAGMKGPQPAVIFLHGFGSSLVVGYEPWLEHLAREGITVIFPTWQQPPFPTDGSQNPRTNMFDGIKLALKAVPVQEDKIAAMGLSAGAALAFDYAALSKSVGLPDAGLVYSVYPGRAFPGEKKAILPIPSIKDIPANTKIVSVVSEKDDEAGTRWGIEQYDALASRPANLRQLTYITAPGLGDHYAPADNTSRARHTFWLPFDKLLTEHLGVKRLPDLAVRNAAREAHLVKKHLKANGIFRQKAINGSTKAKGDAGDDAVPPTTGTSEGATDTPANIEGGVAP